jgi:hemerythrin
MPTFVLGNELLDAQHKAVLSCLNQLHTDLVAGKVGTDLLHSAERLDRYCKLHFIEGERLLEEMGFPDLTGHICEDARFLRHLERVTGMFEEMTTTNKVDKILFRTSWFLDHILHLGRQYEAYQKRCAPIRTKPVEKRAA